MTRPDPDPVARGPEAPRRSYAGVAMRGAAWDLLGGGAAQLLQIPATVILARLLTPQEFGVAAAAWFFTKLANRLGTFGTNAALVRLKTITPAHLSTCLVFNLLTGVVLWSALTMAAPLAAGVVRSPEVGEVLPVAALSFLVVPLGSVSMALALREFRFRALTAISLGYQIASIATSIGLGISGYGVWSLVVGQLMGNVGQVAAQLWLRPWRPALTLSWSALQDVLPIGASLQLKRLLDYVANDIDSFLVGRWLGMTELGYYDKAFNTMKRVVDRMAVAPGVTFRIFAVIHEERLRFQRAYRKLVLTITLVGYPAFAVLFVAAPEFILVAYGRQWEASILPFRILCTAGGLKLLTLYASAAVQATGRIWSEIWRQLLQLVVLVGAIWALSDLGVSGAATGVLLATLLMSTLMHGLTARLAGLSPQALLAPHAPGLAVASLLAVELLALHWAFRAGGLEPAAPVLLAADLVVALSTYAVTVWRMRDAAVREMVDEFLTRATPRLGRVGVRLCRLRGLEPKVRRRHRDRHES